MKGRKRCYLDRIDSIFAKLIFQPGDCWLWGGGVNKNGYATTTVDGRYKAIHRMMYENEFKVVLSPDQVVDHLCRTRNCINPLHMEIVTHAINCLRGIGAPAVNAQKIVCDKCGGELLPRGDGGRRCFRCFHENSRKYCTTEEYRDRARSRYLQDAAYREKKKERARKLGQREEVRERRRLREASPEIREQRNRYAREWRARRKSLGV